MAEELTDLDADARLGRLQPVAGALREGAVDRVRSALLAGASPLVEERLKQASARSELVLAGSRHDPGVERMRALMFAADSIVALGAEGELTAADVHATTAGLEEVLDVGPDAIAFMLYSRVVAAPQLYELPPLTAMGLQLRLLVDLRVFDEASLWRRGTTGETECLIDIGSGEVSRQTRREVRSVLGGRSALRIVGQAAYRSAPLYRFQQLVGVMVGRAAVADRGRPPPSSPPARGRSSRSSSGSSCSSGATSASTHSSPRRSAASTALPSTSTTDRCRTFSR